MVIFIDTSAILPLLNESDPDHLPASDALRRHLDTARFVTSNYVVLETVTLLQRRFGIRAVRLFSERLLPIIEVIWIDAARHDQAVARLLASRSRRVSLVDRVSFDLMRELGAGVAFTYDADFHREGFATLD